MKPVDREFFNPSYEEFKPKTLWSLENSFTSAFKLLKEIPKFQATAHWHIHEERHTTIQLTRTK